MTKKKEKCVPYVEPIICVHPDTYKQLMERKEYEEINNIIEGIANKSQKMYTEEELEKLMNNRAYHA